MTERDGGGRHRAPVTWPCARCGADNPIDHDGCADCGAPFLNALADGGAGVRRMPLLGPLATRSTLIRVSAALALAGLVSAVLVGVLALLGRVL